ncbi:MAG TPA: VCBS repeat-containing protein [Planctomycetota bacterium]|nr:VCBS repeat-containing protein [Planctomycetota bacterium]
MSPLRRSRGVVVAAGLLHVAGICAAQVPVPPLAQPPTLSLSATPSFTSAGSPPLVGTDVAAADFDGNGLADFVTANSGDGSLSLVLQTTVGTFAAAIRLPIAGVFLATGPLGMAVGDLDASGLPDVVVAYPGSSNGAVGAGLFVFRNTGGTLAGGPLIPTVAPTNFGPNIVALGDFDRDGDLDVALTTLAGAQIHANAAGAIAAAPVATLAAPAGFTSVSVAVGDVNGDGFADLWIAHNNGALNAALVTAAVNTTVPPAAPTFSATVITPATPQILTIAAGDVNLDGLSDAAVAGAASAEQFLTSGGGPIAAVPTPAVPAMVAGGGPRCIRPIFWDGDGAVDFLLGDDSGLFVVLRSDQSLLAAVDGPFNATGATGSVSTAAADFDGDGAADVVVVDSTRDLAAVYANLTPFAAWSATLTSTACQVGTLTMTPPQFSGSVVVPGSFFVTWNFTSGAALGSKFWYLLLSSGGSTAPWSTSPCTLWVVTPIATLVASGVTDAAGAFSFTSGTADPTPSPALIGFQFTTQALIYDPGNVTGDYWHTDGVVGALGF